MSDQLTRCYPILRHFQYSHLPPRLRPVSQQFHDLALALVMDLPQDPELEVALRKLLEAKDCAVRAALYVPEPVDAA